MDKREWTAQKAAYFCELGLLRFLYEKAVLTEREYLGIRKIAEEQAAPLYYV